MNAEKRAIRQLLREQRRALSARVVEAAGRAVRAQLAGFPPYHAAVSVITYVADENEVPTAALLDEAARCGRHIYLPRSSAEEGLLRWQPGEPLAAGRGGVCEPMSRMPSQPEVPAIAFVPVVGWDRQGHRLGRGGGFYDRIFARLTEGITRVGLAYEFQECPALPRDPWDIGLDYVITERRIVRCGSVVRDASLQKGGLQLS